MSDQQKMTDIETLARMAARLAGRNPDEHFKMALGDVVPFDGPMWSYPDFLARADAAYHALTTPRLTVPPTKKHYRGVAGVSDTPGPESGVQTLTP